MDSHEEITFDSCHKLTNAGIAKLARLPKLMKVRVYAREVTLDVRQAFSARVTVDIN